MEIIEIELEGFPVLINLLSYTPADPGCTSGAPDRAYPPSDAEVDWVAATDSDLLNFMLNEAYEDKIEEAIFLYLRNATMRR